MRLNRNSSEYCEWQKCIPRFLIPYVESKKIASVVRSYLLHTVRCVAVEFFRKKDQVELRNELLRVTGLKITVRGRSAMTVERLLRQRFGMMNPSSSGSFS